MNTFRNGDKVYTTSDIERLEHELAKANACVEKYKNAIDGECILWDFTVDDENPRKSIKQLLDIADAVARDTDVSSKARKFAIEQKIEVLDRLEGGLQWSSDKGDLVVTAEYIAERIKQLRKEQEK